jgi:hypothetical protein
MLKFSRESVTIELMDNHFAAPFSVILPKIAALSGSFFFFEPALRECG